MSIPRLVLFGAVAALIVGGLGASIWMALAEDRDVRVVEVQGSNAFTHVFVVDHREIKRAAWEFKVTASKAGVYELETWLAYRTSVHQTGGAGEVVGRIEWSLEGENVYDWTNYHAIEPPPADARRAGEITAYSRYGAYGGDQEVRIALPANEEVQCRIVATWTLNVERPGDSTLKLHEFDAHLAFLDAN